MKIRTDFVTNSSSSSFVINKNRLPEEIKEKVISYIETNFNHSSSEQLLDDIENYNVDLYNLVDYQPHDEEMHIWVRRDESMNDDFIDDILYEYDYGSAKFDYHY